MKLIIDIPEEDYIRLRDEGMFGNVTTFKRAVREGIPLEQETCEDCISRQAVLDLPRIKTHNVWGNVIHESVDVEDIRQLPPVKPTEKVGQWIPVSERLPKGYERVLVTRRMFHWANEPVEYTVGIESFGGNVDFIAWMPLPEPYMASPTGAERSEK